MSAICFKNTFSAPWDKTMMSEAAKLELNL